MPRNVEIKARVSDMTALQDRAQTLTNNAGTVLVQEDTFYNVSNGRLKLRQCTARPSVLIHYDRNDQLGPKMSHYNLVQVDDVENLKVVLDAALGIKGVVKKTRLLFLLDQTRIHLDDVENLGHFMELEVVLQDDQTEEEGQQIALNVMDSLGINKDNLVDCAYLDMLIQTHLC